MIPFGHRTNSQETLIITFDDFEVQDIDVSLFQDSRIHNNIIGQNK